MVDAPADPASHGGDPADAFEVIVPSLPGYGVLGPAHHHRRGRGASCATVGHADDGRARLRALRRPGWRLGAIITGWLGHAHPESLIGVYLTLPIVPGLLGKRAPKPADFGPDEQWMVERADQARRLTEAHVAVHRRDPQTFAYAMADSPAGLGAWLWHRRQLLVRRRRPRGVRTRRPVHPCRRCTGSTRRWRRRSGSMPRSSQAEHHAPRPASRIDVPTGFGVFAKELLFIPRAIAETTTNLHRWWSVFDRGGHFAPRERPDAVVSELQSSSVPCDECSLVR